MQSNKKIKVKFKLKSLKNLLVNKKKKYKLNTKAKIKKITFKINHQSHK